MKRLTNALRLPIALTILAAGFLMVTPATAGPIITFSVSTGTQPSNVGVITLTQVNSTTVNVLVDLNDTTLPSPQYGFVNTGNDNHTSFVFTLSGTEVGLSASFIQPLGGNFTFGVLSLNLAGGGATPFGTYGVAIDNSAGNGSSNAYYGDLEFNLTRASGLDTTSFIANADGYYFAADLTNGTQLGNTGSQAWATPSTSVPEPSTITLLATALAGLGIARRRIGRM